MTFSYLVKGKFQMGGRKVQWGTYTNAGGDTGGDITVYMRVVENFILQQSGSTVVATEPTVNETLPLKNGGVVTIKTTDGADGYWLAIGK
jgi:hypothetical protein